jgi:hypothetical protein
MQILKIFYDSDWAVRPLLELETMTSIFLEEKFYGTGT